MMITKYREVIQPVSNLNNFILCLLLPSLLTACATPLARTPVPVELTSKARVSNLEVVGRVWGDASRSELGNFWDEKFKKTPKFKVAQTTKSGRPIFNILALSGGGDNGAFGAGILNGWSTSGKRPEFTIVTGVSTGALSAPFAFLGPDYDDELREIYLNYSTNDLLIFKPIKGILGGTSLADSSPLAKILASHIDQNFLNKIATEYKKGRYLLVATTNIDTERQVIWNMGAIALSNHKDSVELFRKVLLASAAIPGVFPPVTIKVTANGKTYDELHVDGGLTRQVFLAPPSLSLRNFDKQFHKKPIYNVYIIRNGHTNPIYKQTKSTALALAGRSISTVTKSQGVGDLYRIYAVCQRDKLKFNVISIPKSVEYTAKEAFDTVYMTKLYNHGFTMFKEEQSWRKKPNGL